MLLNLNYFFLLNLMTIYTEAQFKYNQDLTNIDFNDNDVLAEDTFLNCKNLEFDHLPKISKIPAYCFVGCKCCKNLVIPDTVKEIGECAFLSCKNIESIVLPEGLTKIDKYAFEQTGITELTLPKSLTNFDYSIISNCENLEMVKVKTKEQFDKLKPFEHYNYYSVVVARDMKPK